MSGCIIQKNVQRQCYYWCSWVIVHTQFLSTRREYEIIIYTCSCLQHIYTVDCFHKGCNYCMNMNRKIKIEECKRMILDITWRKKNNIENVTLYFLIQWSRRSKKGNSHRQEIFDDISGGRFLFPQWFQTPYLYKTILTHAYTYIWYKIKNDFTVLISHKLNIYSSEWKIELVLAAHYYLPLVLFCVSVVNCWIGQTTVSFSPTF